MRFFRPAGLFLAALPIGWLSTWASQPYRFPGRDEAMLFFTIGAMLGLGWRFGAPALLGIAGGALAYYLFDYGLAPWMAAWTTASLLLSSWIALWGIRRFAIRGIHLSPLHAMLVFYLFGVLLAPTLHTLLDWPMVRLGGLVERGEDPRVFLFLYWLGEALGALLVAPVTALLGQRAAILGPFRQATSDTFRLERLLWVVLFTALLALTWLAGQRYLYNGISDVLMPLFALLLWSAFRFDMTTTLVAVLATVVTIFSFINFGIGGSRSPGDIPDLITLLILLTGISVLTQVASAAILERRQKAERLAYHANHDPVTGLANEQSLRERIEPLLTMNDAGGAAIGYLEIDEYPSVRAHYGPAGRDDLLRQFSGWLRRHLPEGIAPHHVTAGEFAMLFASSEQARAALDALLGEDERIFVWRERRIPLAIKAGYAEIREAFGSAQNLLSIVASHVHAMPRDQFHAANIDPLNDGLIQQRELLARWHAELHQALAENRFSLVAQPIRPLPDPNDGEITHLEFLVRLRARDGELVEPGVFLPHAEQLGLMPEIDRWVIDAALRLIATHLLPHGGKPLCNINLSGQSLNDEGFTEYLRHRLENTRVPREMLCFEITESIALSNLESTRELMHELHRLGCSIAIDDFGTGAATLEYLKRLPVDYVKIDGSFIRELEASQLDYIIVDAITQIASENGVRTIAEYVESEAVARILRVLHIDFVQGYLYGRPEQLDALFATPETVDA